MAAAPRWHGLLNIDKPAAMTSTDVVRVVRRLAAQSQVGHGGTLDPLATGVLPIALGAATRLLEYLQEEAAKRYTATLLLGAATTTDDAEGELIAEAPVPPLDPETIQQVLARFVGPLEQVPPRYAAIRVQGKRLYEYARAGETVEIAPRAVSIYELQLLDYAPTTWVLDVSCSKGTYIRALARDIGAALGCGAHLKALRRTQAGPFTLATAVPLEQLQANPELLTSSLLPPQAVLQDWPSLVVTQLQAQRLRQGQRIDAEESAERAAALDQDGSLVAVVIRVDDQWQPAKVFKPYA